jgi:hypothetical protein
MSLHPATVIAAECGFAPVIAVAAEEPENALPVHNGDQPVTIMFDLVEPAIAGRGLSSRADDL